VTVAVSVYQKNGLCRGPGIGTATFYAILGIVVVHLPAAGGGPLSGKAHIYTVTRPPGYLEWTLEVDAPNYQPWRFFVRDGETHEVWLTHR
jgi:hypothetical protein